MAEPVEKIVPPSAWEDRKSRMAYGALRRISRALSACKLTTALRIGRYAGGLAFSLVRRNRAEVLAEMQRAYRGDSLEEAEDRLRRVYKHVAMNYAEVFRWIGGGSEELDGRIREVGAEHLEAALARGKGVLVLTAHLGNWDLVGLWAARRYPLTIISKDLRQAGVNRFWMEARQEAGLDIVPARRSYLACLGVLKKNGLLGFILDQNALVTEGVFVDFFGKQACTRSGLAFLSAHAQAPVLPAFIHRKLDGTHQLEFLPLLEPPADREPATLQAATQRYTRIIEDAIRRHPDQWIWMHRRWRTRPPADERAQPVPGPNRTEKKT